jgi:hypothetical protein
LWAENKSTKVRNITVNSQGFELSWSVPETEDEYNRLAPKRLKPCLEDAIMNTWYRNGANKFRDGLCEYLEDTTGVERLNTGTEEKPVWETESKYIRRVIVSVAQQRGLDPAAKATTETLIAEWTPAAQKILSGIAFDPSEREPSERVAPLAKTYIAWADKAVQMDNGVRLAGLLAKVLGVSITLGTDPAANVKTLARAIATNEARKRALEAAKAKEEYGV